MVWSTGSCVRRIYPTLAPCVQNSPYVESGTRNINNNGFASTILCTSHVSCPTPPSTVNNTIPPCFQVAKIDCQLRVVPHDLVSGCRVDCQRQRIYLRTCLSCDRLQRLHLIRRWCGNIETTHTTRDVYAYTHSQRVISYLLHAYAWHLFLNKWSLARHLWMGRFNHHLSVGLCSQDLFILCALYKRFIKYSYFHITA